MESKVGKLCIDQGFALGVKELTALCFICVWGLKSELTIAQQFLDRCFKRRYTSKKLEIGELLKVQDQRICRKVSSIPNHPLRVNFSETKITRYNLRKKSPAMPAIHTDRFNPLRPNNDLSQTSHCNIKGV